MNVIKVLTALLIFTTATFADGDAHNAAVQRARDATTRVWYHEMQTTIADRDIATARIISETATTARREALSEHRSADADRWAKRLAEAQRDEREAQGRADTNRRELSRAQSDLQAATEDVRKTERVARRR